MLRALIFSCIAGFLLVACTKTNASEESLFYGRWVNAVTPNDTLWFTSKSGKNILRINNSFNPSLPFYDEYEYGYKNGKLSVILPGATPFKREVDSFNWTQTNKEFEILGYQLYLFMSSTSSRFTYRKLPL